MFQFLAGTIGQCNSCFAAVKSYAFCRILLFRSLVYSDISSTYDLITIFLFLMRVGRYPAGLLHIDMSDVEKSSSANKLTWLEILMVNDGLASPRYQLEGGSLAREGRQSAASKIGRISKNIKTSALQWDRAAPSPKPTLTTTI